jgi:hypothetical protein
MTERTNDQEALAFHKEKLNEAKEEAKHTHTGTCEHDTAEAKIDFHLESTFDHLDDILGKQEKELKVLKKKFED